MRVNTCRCQHQCTKQAEHENYIYITCFNCKKKKNTGNKRVNNRLAMQQLHGE